MSSRTSDTSSGSAEESTQTTLDEEKYRRSKLKFKIGCILISLGVLLTLSSSSWDITNHLINKPETFFSTPHLLLYTGVGVAALGSAIMFVGKRSFANQGKFKLPMRLVIIGISMVVIAGPFDYNWHVAFGLDGLLSPSHFILTFGLFLASIGALSGLVFARNYSPLLTSQKGGNQIEQEGKPKQSVVLPSMDNLLSVIGILPLWLTASGLLYMFSLPFSDTQSFDFNPDPTFAAIFATIGFPLLLSTILYLSYGLNYRFGILSITGAAFLLISILTTMIPNEFLVPTISFYFLSIIPFVVADTILSYSKTKSLQYVAGGVLGSCSFMVYYPFITYVYNGVFTHKVVFPSLIAPIYSELMISSYSLLVGPLIAAGILGVILGRYIISHSKILEQKIE
ncbi:MAG: hypothetical protein IIA83_01140 [Thaumarchaeota archaeon]|nr:hypothetical protein [Nitrososphaerota archaeon]